MIVNYIDYDKLCFHLWFEDMVAVGVIRKLNRVGILKSLKISFSEIPAVAVDDLKPWFSLIKILLGESFRKIFRRK